MTEQKFTPITDENEVERLLARSKDEPVLIFKHDPYCGVSSMAYREMSKLDGPIPLIDVARQRTISLNLAARIGVKHESPQVILLHDGQAVWATSHYNITAATVTRVLRALTDALMADSHEPAR